jgi:hypothetical protein
MPRVGFEPTIPAFEREKTIHVLDRAATVIDTTILAWKLITISNKSENYNQIRNLFHRRGYLCHSVNMNNMVALRTTKWGPHERHYKHIVYGNMCTLGVQNMYS